LHIQQIEIDNFKSFSNKTVIPFEKGFTTISGPNGSGKSNIIDSILFCLGLSSSRTMRAEKLTDLINNLSRRREASVTIMFGNTDTSGEEKILVTRKIKDNGQTGYGSTYYLNGKVTTLTDIHDNLSRHNISPGAYNVLMQGDVTGIINMTAMERRKIIDEIAGVAEFDRKIDQAQKELESVSGSIERFGILLGELEARVTQLSQERDQALKYQKLKDEKQRFEGMMLTAKYLDLKKAAQATDQNILQARKQKTVTQEQLSGLEEQIGKTRDALTKISNEVKRKGEDQQIALKKQIEGLKGAISRKKDSIQFGAEKRQENLRTHERAQEEIERLKQKIEDLTVSMEGFRQQEKELQALLEKELAALESLKQNFANLVDSSGALSERRQEIRDALQKAEDTLSLSHRQRLDAQAELERIRREKTYQEERSSTSSQRRQEIETRDAELAKVTQDSDLERQAFETQIQKQTLEVAKIRVDLNTAMSDINKLHREFTQLDAQKRAYEEMNLGRAVDTIMNADIAGVHGTLAQLGTVDEEFSVALETALGGRMRSVVVDNDNVAQQGIELLQQTRAGRATFLPLNKMRDSQYLSLLPNDDGIVDYAINLIAFDHEYKDVFAYALGDTVIVEDMAVARKYLRQYRMVTLDGSLLEKTGAMTGGSAPSAGGKLASGKSDQQLKTLREQLEQKDEEKDRLEKKLTAAEIKLDSYKEDYGKFLTELQRHQLERETLGRELKQISAVSGSETNLDGLDAQIATLTGQCTTLETQIEATGKEVEGLRENLAEIDQKLPTEALERLKSDMDTIEFQIKAYETQIRNVLSEIQSKQLEKEFQEKGIQSYVEQLAQTKINNEAIEKEKQQHLEEIQLIEKQIIALEAQAGEIDVELQRLQEERDKIQAQLIQEEQKKYNLTRDLSLIEEQVLAYQARKKELLPEIEAVKAELIEAGIQLDALPEEELPGAEDITRNIQKLERQMEAMGPVNMRSLQDYDEVISRHQELTDKIGTLSREKEDLGIKISGYSELKLHAFMTAFENVDNNFKDIFGELSDGEGSLVLANKEDPFSGGLTIEARPRGKKMQRLESMSGGEKSLTALAFVFSFQRYMPAPFYAFDEVDMFLDGINAEKLAGMVKKQSDSAQFIVVSLRKPMLQHSDRTVGVTQKRDGISKVTGVMLQDAS
jgi:chromosome segregation protein